MVELTDTERLKALRQRLITFIHGLEDAAAMEVHSGNPIIAQELSDTAFKLRQELQGDLVGG